MIWDRCYRVSRPSPGIGTIDRVIAPTTMKRTMAQTITTMVYPIAFSSGAFISFGRPRKRRYKE